jgi:hypothetical protein
MVALVEQVLHESCLDSSDSSAPSDSPMMAVTVSRIVSIFLTCRITRVLISFDQATRHYFRYLALGHDAASCAVAVGQMKAHVQAKEEMHGTKAALRIVKYAGSVRFIIYLLLLLLWWWWL